MTYAFTRTGPEIEAIHDTVTDLQNRISNKNLIQNSDFSIPGSVANPPDSTPRSYSDGDEIFKGFKALGLLSGVTYINGVLGGSGQLYVDLVKVRKQLDSTSNVTPSVAGSDGVPVTTGISVVDNGSSYRVTFDLDGVFSVKLEYGDNASFHNTSEIPALGNYEVIDANFDNIFRHITDYNPPNVPKRGTAATGQSLMEGGIGGDSVSGVHTPAFPGRTLMFNPQPVGLNTQTLQPSLVDLVEPSRVTVGHSVTKNLAMGNDDIRVFSGQAWGGKAYSDLMKGGSTGVYEKVIQQVNNADNIYSDMEYDSVICIHGEQDGLNNNTSYSLNLNQWQTDFDTDIKNITGQTDDVPLYLCQTATAGGYNFNGGITQLTFPTPVQQLLAHETYPNVVMVCSKYHLEYADHSHIRNISQRLLGEYYAKAISQGPSFSPLRPDTITANGSSVVIDFAGAVGNLVFDTTRVQSITNSGFSYVDDSGNTITGVAITGNTQVTISLSGNVGANAVIAYAYHNGAGGAANQVSGLGDRGNLRDSDPAVSSYDGTPLYNWCVIFRKEIN